MKQYILKVAQDLEQGIITEDKARSLLLGLFGVSGSLLIRSLQLLEEMVDNHDADAVRMMDLQYTEVKKLIKDIRRSKRLQ